MGDSMEKGTNKKKTTTGTNSKKSTGAKKANAKKGAPTKKNSNGVAKKDASTPKVVTSPEKETAQVATKTVVKVETQKTTDKEEKNVVSSVKKIETEHGEKLNKKKEKVVVENNEFTNLIKIVIIVTAIFLAFYLITYLVAKNKANKKQDTDKDTAEVSIQYDEILISNLLKQKNSEYYVLAYDAKDVYYDTYNTYLTTYTGKNDTLRVYKSILTNGFNKSYYDADAESKTDISSIDELKLNSSTLIRVKDGKIDAVYEGHDAIVTQLKTLTD